MSEAFDFRHVLSEEDYLKLEENGAVRHEFVDGIMYAMADVSLPHNELVNELLFRLRSHLPPSCRTFTLDAKVRIEQKKSSLFYYPDLMVACDSIKKGRHYIENPILIAEILSPSTERSDRIEKLAAYSQIPSLQDYVLVAQDVPKIEVFRRSEGWRREEFYREHTITLASVEIQLWVQELYARIGF